MAKRAVIAGVAVALLAVAIIVWAATRMGAPSETGAPEQWVRPPAARPPGGSAREEEAGDLFFRARLAVGMRKWAEAKEHLDKLGFHYADTVFVIEHRGVVAQLRREAEAALGPAPSAPSPTSGGDFVLDFNGQSDYVEIPDSPALRLETFTVEAWVWRRQGGQALQHLFAKDSGRTHIESFGIAVMNNWRWHYTIGYGAKAEVRGSPAECTPHTWTHCALVFDRGDCALFVNGKQVERSRIGPRPLYDDRPFHIGTDLEYDRFTYFWNGALDEVRLSSAVRYSGDFTPARRFAPDAQTVLLLHFDEGQGETARDSSRLANHGLIHGARFIPRDKLEADAR